MASFDFVTDREFRTSLESDHAEMGKCVEHQCWKAALVLAGSVIEALLVDSLLAAGKTEPDPLAMTLHGLIDEAMKAGILSAKSRDLSAVVKGFRNLIHPARARRLNESPDEKSARVAQQLVEMILEEVVKKRKETYGYTAEQIATKLERDPSSVSIVLHLLRETRESEQERLLIEVLPSRHFSLAWQYSEFDRSAECSAIAEGFRIAFGQASDAVKRKATANFIKALKEESESYVVSYELAFFRAEDLAYASSEDVTLVKDHLLARLGENVTCGLLDVCSGIGGFLKVDEIPSLVDPVVRKAFVDRGFLTEAFTFLQVESYEMKRRMRTRLREHFDIQANWYDQLGHPEFAQEIRRCREYVEADIPS
jgi:hypothetical protein